MDPDRYLAREERIRRLRLPVSGQAQWLAGRTALKIAYREFFGLRVPLPAIETWNDRLGRPQVGGPGGWSHCSLSHTDGWALAAVSPTPIGVDVECVRNVSPQLIRFVATSVEWHMIERSTPPEAAPLRLWTLKEAVLKGLGTGFRTDPRSVRVVEANARVAAVEVAGVAHVPGRHWRVSSEILDGRVVSIAHVSSHVCSASICWLDRTGISAALDTT